jgi:hypothetical protein
MNRAARVSSPVLVLLGCLIGTLAKVNAEPASMQTDTTANPQDHPDKVWK